MRAIQILIVPLLLALVAIPLVGSDAAVAAPEEPTSVERARTLRADLDAPNPATALRFAGEAANEKARMGEVSLVARAKRAGRSSVWSVEERIEQSWGGERLSLHAAFELLPDLSLRSGSYVVEIRGSRFALTLLRSPEGKLQVTRTVTPWKGLAKRTQFEVDAPADVMVGTASLSLLARSMGKGGEHKLVVSKLDLYGMAVRGVKGAAASQTLEVHRAGAPVALKRPVGDPLETEVVELRWTSDVPEYLTPVNLHLSPGGRTLLARQPVKEGGARAWWPKGSLEAAPALPEEAKAERWEQALLKFGYGYHMARRELLEEAFFWDAFRASEVAAGSWKADEDVDAFRAAWIDAFFQGSENRTRAATTQLLNGTLKTGTARKVDADHVVFKADPQFGGGVQRTYYFARKAGVWRLERIQF